MIESPSVNLWSIAPEIILAASAILVLLLGTLPSAAARWISSIGALAGLVGAGVMTALAFSTPYLDEFAGQVSVDEPANLVRLLAIGAGAVGVVMSMVSRPDDRRDAEHYALLLLATCGMGFFAIAGSLMAVFVGLELFSIALYVLCALEADRVTALESGLKYLVIGGLGSALFLYGTAMLYGATGSFGLSEIAAGENRGGLLYVGAALVIAALGFKASAAPLHWWTPDVYDGASTPVTMFMATATKVVTFLVIARVLTTALLPEADIWEPMVAAAAVASIVVGNLGAIVQRRLKRMLAYSSIAHAGYLLIGVVAWQTLEGFGPLLYALVVYVVMTAGAFVLIGLRERRTDQPVTFDDLAGTGWPVEGAADRAATTPGVTVAALAGSLLIFGAVVHALMAGGVQAIDLGLLALAAVFAAYAMGESLAGVALAVLMLSLAGLPPTGGFFAKFALFQAAVEAGYGWLAVVGVVGSAVSLVYYLRVIVVMYMQPRPAGRDAVAVEERAALPVPAADLPMLIPQSSARMPVLSGLGVLLAVATLLLGVVPTPALEIARDADDARLTARD